MFESIVRDEDQMVDSSGRPHMFCREGRDFARLSPIFGIVQRDIVTMARQRWPVMPSPQPASNTAGLACNSGV
jgi:hypothetical protein